MDPFARVDRWCRMHKLCMNRVNVINVITHETAIVEHGKGLWRVRLFDRIVAEYRIYALDEVEIAFQRLDAVTHVLWDARREKLVDFG